MQDASDESVDLMESMPGKNDHSMNMFRKLWESMPGVSTVTVYHEQVNHLMAGWGRGEGDQYRNVSSTTFSFEIDVSVLLHDRVVDAFKFWKESVTSTSGDCID